jgi:hypothetical protein
VVASVVADVYWFLEEQGVDTGGDGLFSAVFLSGHGSDHVYPADDDTAESSAVLVGVVGHDDVSRLDGAVGWVFGFFSFIGFPDHFYIL